MKETIEEKLARKYYSEVGVPYVTKYDFVKQEVEHCLATFVGTQVQINEAKELAKKEGERKYAEARDLYNAARFAKEEEFFNDACEDLGIADEPYKRIIFAKAWEDSHSDGYSAVYHRMDSYVELILDVLKTFK
jgi:hypothetical protein